MNPSGTLTPAYGRDYESIKAMQADFDAGKDFRLNTYQGDTLCSITDFRGKGKIPCRYKRLTMAGMLSYDRP
jgi:hypothetical protein